MAIRYNKSLVDPHIDRIAAATTSRQLSARLRALAKAIDAHYENKNSRIVQRYNALKAVTQHLSSEAAKAKAKQILKPDAKSLNAYKRRTARAARQRIETAQAVITPADLQNLVEIAKDELGERSKYRRLLAVMLLTGRRPTELNVAGAFEPIEGSDSELLFTAQAKTKKPIPPYAIPVLHGPREILQAQSQIAGTLRGTPRELGDAFRRIYAPHVAGLERPYDLRALYLYAAYREAQQSNPDLLLPEFARRVLGHLEHGTGALYLRFLLKNQ